MEKTEGTACRRKAERASRFCRTALALGALFFFPVASPPAGAQEAGESGATGGPDEAIEAIIVTGTRRIDRTEPESLSPIDVLTGSELESQGYVEMDDLLRTSVPSYQVNTQPISDASTLIRPATLRGLAPDQSLVLVNGQRRHRGAVIAFLSDSITRGAQGPDLSVIPALALERVEVLRDGASAQYGSDAIAGVLNFVLKEDASGGSFKYRRGEYYEGDGGIDQFAGNIGLPLGEDGFLNLTAEYLEQDDTIRNVQRDDVTALLAKRAAAPDAWNDYVNALDSPIVNRLDDSTQIWGSPIIHDSFNLFANAGYEIGPRAKLYGFGNWAQREVEGGFYFRNPDTRNGVFQSGGMRLVGPTVAGADCSAYRQAPAGASDGAAAIRADFANLKAIAEDDDCFAFNEIYPNGFTPRFGGEVTDLSAAGGVKGEFDNGFRYDLGVYFGRNEADYFIFNTVNAARGPDQPGGAHFDPGTYIQEETGINADFAHMLDVGFLPAPLHVAFGAEWREESFEVEAGDPYSWVAPDAKDRTPNETLLLAAGFTPASNGFSGFAPAIAGTWDRSNTSLYLDLETDLLDALSVGAAVRFEDYEDFGSTTNGKLAAHWRLSDGLALRGTFSTGFRAPTPGQANINNVSTSYDAIKRDLVEDALVPPTHPIALRYGGQELEPEESTNWTLGLVWTSPGGLSLTVDAFLIELDDRIGTTDKITLTDADVKAARDAGLAGVTAGSQINYYTNAWATETKGVELVATWSADFGAAGNTNFTLAGSWIDTEVTDRGVYTTAAGDRVQVVSDRLDYNASHQLPKTRAALTANHLVGNWRIMGRGSYWGSWRQIDDGDDRAYGDGSSFVLDLEAGYRFDVGGEGAGLELVVGAQNVLDTYPSRHPYGVSGSGQKYGEYAPFGFNGGFWYSELRYDF